MNKLATSVGVIALSVTGLHAAYAPNLTTMEKAKPWSISASLRGFYDDNYLTVPNNVARDSLGFEVSPTVSLNLPFEQSFLGLSYVYSARYFADRDDDPFDQTHQVNAKADHAFSERYKLELSDSFVSSQEPDVVDQDGIRTIFFRTEGDNIRNRASADFTAQMTPLLGLQFRYDNTLVDFEQEGTLNSRSAVLDRMEHLGTVNLRWQVLRQTVGIVGYSFELVDYTADDSIGVPQVVFFGPIPLFAVNTPVDPETRNRRSHMFYIGADQNFNSKLNGSVRVGGIYSEFYNISDLDPILGSNIGELNTIGPYADVALTYTYSPGSYVQAGLRHARNSTDLVSFLQGTQTALVTDQESTSVYAALTHRITARTSANLLGQYQHSITEGLVLPSNDVADLGADDFFTFGLNLAYRINPFWSTELGWNFDRLDSDMPFRSYTRNRVYVGVRATY